MYDIIIGRSESDKKRHGLKGTIFLGRHYVKMGQTTALSNNVYLDISRSHVVFVCGKRGSGKSYSLGVLAEGLSDMPKEVKNNLSIVIVDTMGIYWTMKYPNKKDELLLKEWKLNPKSIDIVIYTPKDFYTKYKQEGIPTDKPFTVKTSELSGTDWCMIFEISENDQYGVLLDKVVQDLQEKTKDYDVQDIILGVEQEDAESFVKKALVNKLVNAKRWGVFSNDGTELHELVQGGQVTILDVSCYATMPGGWNIKSLVLGLVCQKLFTQRMVSRKDEEYKEVHSQTHFFSDTDDGVRKDPLVWIVIDEAHEFLPKEGKTAASDALITILREGRQPGISLVLASQQPGKIHTDVMTQSDTVLSHRITAKIDTEALGALMQSYMRTGLDNALDDLPRDSGAAVIFDDQNEKMYPIRVRPRFTWHGGESPQAIPKRKQIYDF